MTDQPVTAPATCEEPIYQLTPGATVPAVVPLPVCPVAGVAVLPNTGTGTGGDSGLWMPLLLLGMIVLGWWSLRCAERAFDQVEMP
jgi:hypothetical protein